MAKPPPKVAKGQVVYCIRRFSRPPELGEFTVESVGRKYGYLSNGECFFLDSMKLENGEGFVHLSREAYEEHQLASREAYEEHQLAAKLWSQVRYLPWFKPAGVTSADIKAALRLLGREVPE